MTDTDFLGSVMVRIRVDLVFNPESLRVFTVANPIGVNPRKEIVVVNEFVGFVFTALIKIVLPLRLAVASRYGTFTPSREVLKVGLLTVVASRTSPRCVF